MSLLLTPRRLPRSCSTFSSLELCYVRDGQILEKSEDGSFESLDIPVYSSSPDRYSSAPPSPEQDIVAGTPTNRRSGPDLLSPFKGLCKYMTPYLNEGKVSGEIEALIPKDDTTPRRSPRLKSAVSRALILGTAEAKRNDFNKIQTNAYYGESVATDPMGIKTNSFYGKAVKPEVKDTSNSSRGKSARALFPSLECSKPDTENTTESKSVLLTNRGQKRRERSRSSSVRRRTSNPSKRGRFDGINRGISHGIRRPKMKKLPLKFKNGKPDRSKLTTKKPVLEKFHEMSFSKVDVLPDRTVYEETKPCDENEVVVPVKNGNALGNTNPDKKIKKKKKTAVEVETLAKPDNKFFKSDRKCKVTVNMGSNIKLQMKNGALALKKKSTSAKKQKNSNVPSEFETEHLDSVELVKNSIQDNVKSIIDQLDFDSTEKECQSPAYSHTLQSIADKGRASDVGPSRFDISKLYSQPLQSRVNKENSPKGEKAQEMEDGGKENRCAESSDNQKYFSLFLKDSTSKLKQKKIFEDITNKKTAPAKALKKRFLVTTEDSKYEQLIIDAGQKEYGATVCQDCGVVYEPGDPQDEAMHYSFHNEQTSKLKFKGWKQERIVAEYLDDGGRVVCVRPRDSANWWEKVNKVLEVVNLELGFSGNGIRNFESSMVFLYIVEKRVVGCIVAETVKEAYRILSAKDGTGTAVSSDQTTTCSNEPEPVKCGVNRLWVHSSARRKKAASRLVDCMRLNFLVGEVLKKNEIAFSAPTASGKAFAQKYVETGVCLVYNA